ncbi:phosphoserine phosphatase [Alkalihalobacillus alcalophilus ATCC 27647 = CGMCC 1.3604]|uniref:Phosphoserine phosphatase n=1 Tax=Alkalihalobacillus alcalophilus ATCC 27647 = CGMCC 1.3604 TaxID=1218173 RepID=A0A094YRU7_ALKAL|nr:PP2C family protein-serine/threonine phosphatase [Alkalihalobacillus alcalophilus]KGA96212.1 phosphoserine phosphatase [Alkalihalobacillus alcalophilus ATCC 27647 = CGMCC 1.3604]MED1563008.1 PP2C family protein-serine/threonine phosphatase [Alkalihalobacillus alcalophilus]THG92307.1 phosphoserine phosphatase [Alkalihalobacillus alcalophilus ATCC 27647 = CGMCC 1.3604]
MSDKTINIEQRYKKIVETFLDNKSELGLYQAQQFSKLLLADQVSPEEFIDIHRAVLDDLFPSIPDEVQDSFDLLLEVMMSYGLVYREHQILKHRQQELESEIEVAASMQQTLLPKGVPDISQLDIGVISIPAKKMSGDYYHFVQGGENTIGIAIADIIGKGIPAALCMSMIKYAMDGLPKRRLNPAPLLESLNHVVEQNVDDSMFITMMYGEYNTTTNRFQYAGAGHEPGFVYRAKEDIFEDLYAKGLALGISKVNKFKEYHREIEVGDFIVLLSDGVTESVVNNEFIEREELTRLMRGYMNGSAQEMVDGIYTELEKAQDFNLRDDFTLIVIKRMV